MKTYEDYNISDLNSEDETDDEEEPSKPIPLWARNPNLLEKAQKQSIQKINFTKLFKAASRDEIVLEDIFKIKRKNFYERSSSAIWNSPPVWRTNGLNGDESYRQLKN
jgi:inner centromere protein